jgi:hypothetical protein
VVQHKHIVALAVGGGVFSAGALAVITDVGAAVISKDATNASWFRPLFAVGVVLIVISLYPLIVVPLLGAPFPDPRSEPIWHGWRPRLPFYRPPEPSSITEDQTAIRARGSAVLAELRFTTSARPGLHSIVLQMEQRIPVRLDFVQPRRQTVRASDLPVVIPGKHGDLRIKSFIAGGFVLEQGRSIGDQVIVELIF